eukprot:TRINITY_DN6505_c0_g3_i2.p1 TRINITY_DN6505_c0_g3~~TRINITY_DN6505_c0_g3_i2.p1  ORF type:complete len:307 (-),score=43.73 TRINITY_DN6505_c0_g3_i2:571-1491(-)
MTWINFNKIDRRMRTIMFLLKTIQSPISPHFFKLSLISSSFRSNVGSLFNQDAISQKVFHGLLLISFLLRSVFFAIIPSEEDGDLSVPETVSFVLNMLPAFLYYSAYTILILYWAEVYHNTILTYSTDYEAIRSSPKSKTASCWGFGDEDETRFSSTSIFLRVNAVVYFLFLILAIMFASSAELRDTVWDVSLTFSASICLLTAFGFLIYGHRQYNMLGQLPVKSGFRSSQLHKVLWVTIICTTCFSIRALIIIWSALIDPLTSNWAVIFAFYFLLEQVPACLMLFLLRKLPRRTGSLLPNGPYAS